MAVAILAECILEHLTLLVDSLLPSAVGERVCTSATAPFLFFFVCCSHEFSVAVVIIILC